MKTKINDKDKYIDIIRNTERRLGFLLEGNNEIVESDKEIIEDIRNELSSFLWKNS